MKFAKETALNNRPHPGPLPQERVNRSPSHETTCDWVCRTISGTKRTIRLLFPLPGGEGQGEGGRHN
jgi:hypothetical protein